LGLSGAVAHRGAQIGTHGVRFVDLGAAAHRRATLTSYIDVDVDVGETGSRWRPGSRA
jgi:hypothetical protein